MKRRPKGSGTIRREGAGYSLRIASKDGPLYESGFRSRTEAENRAALIRAEKMHRRLGVAADPRLTPTLAALAVDLRPGSVAQIRSEAPTARRARSRKR